MSIEGIFQVAAFEKEGAAMCEENTPKVFISYSWDAFPDGYLAEFMAKAVQEIDVVLGII